MMGLVVVYLFLLGLCGFQVSSLCAVMEQADPNQFDDLHLHHVLANISTDEEFCFHCVQRHIGFDHLRKLFDQQNIHRRRNVALKRIRVVFNSLSIVNSAVVFLVVGGPKLIILVMLFSSVSIFGSIFVEKGTDAFVFESVVILVSVVVLLKTLHVISLQVFF